MDEVEREEIRSWLEKARRDLASARKLAAGPDPYLDTAVYHCQQAAEKAVKGFLAFSRQRVERVHDVGALVVLAAALDPRFVPLESAGQALTPYATEYRYPGEKLNPDTQEYEEALANAELIYAFVISILPGEVHPGTA